jgi:hypothetical protein
LSACDLSAVPAPLFFFMSALREGARYRDQTIFPDEISTRTRTSRRAGKNKLILFTVLAMKMSVAS